MSTPLTTSSSSESKGGEDFIEPGFASTASTKLMEAFDAVNSDTKALLALYFYGLCLNEWEGSERYERIEAVLGALNEVAQKAGAKDKSTGAQLSAIIGRHALHVKDAMAAEQAMNCSCPVAMGARADLVLARVAETSADEAGLGNGLNSDGLRRVVRSDAETSWHYFDALKEVAGAVLDYVETDPVDLHAVVDSLYGVVDSLDAPKTASALEGDVYESELRPHRASLAEMEAKAAHPRLMLRAAELAYVYPFALGSMEIDAKQIVDAALEESVKPGEAAGLSSPRPASDHSTQDTSISTTSGWATRPTWAHGWGGLPDHRHDYRRRPAPREVSDARIHGRGAVELPSVTTTSSSGRTSKKWRVCTRSTRHSDADVTAWERSRSRGSASRWRKTARRCHPRGSRTTRRSSSGRSPKTLDPVQSTASIRPSTSCSLLARSPCKLSHGDAAPAPHA